MPKPMLQLHVTPTLAPGISNGNDDIMYHSIYNMIFGEPLVELKQVNLELEHLKLKLKLRLSQVNLQVKQLMQNLKLKLN